MLFDKGEIDSAEKLQRSLQEKATALWDELTQFQAYITSAELDISVSKFCKEVQNETETIKSVNLSGESMGSDDEVETDSPNVHRLRSSNLSFYEAIWQIAKQSKGVVGLQKRMKWGQNPKAMIRGQRSRRNVSSTRVCDRPNAKENAIVDIVAEHGQKWIKVWTKSQQWLLFDMAKEGLVLADSTSDEENDTHGFERQGEDNGLRLVKLANDLQYAARQTRVRHKHPTVHLVLPNIEEGINEEVDMVLRSIRSSGAVVECGSDPVVNRDGVREHSYDLQDVFANMVHETSSRGLLLTSTINVDCTLLVALVSDISHILPSNLNIPKHYEGSVYRTIDRQVESESENPILESELYPLLAGRKITCTSTVASHLRQILQPMGTPDELTRTQILLGEGPYAELSCEELLQKFQRHSAYAVPNSFQLPVRIIDFDHTSDFSDSSSISALEILVARALVQKPKLTYLNASAFISGWAEGIATLTLNRVVSNWMQRTIDEILDEFEINSQVNDDEQAKFQGPAICLCNRDRSLLGSEKSSVRC